MRFTVRSTFFAIISVSSKRSYDLLPTHERLVSICLNFNRTISVAQCNKNVGYIS